MDDNQPNRRPVDWRNRAACLIEDPELFYPIGTVSAAAIEQAERAKQVCATCPVKAICLQYALTTGQHYGVWGGLDEDERRTFRRARGRRGGAQRPAGSAGSADDGGGSAEAAP